MSFAFGPDRRRFVRRRHDARMLLSRPQNNAAVELAFPPIQPAAGQLMAGLERADVLLPVAGGLGVQGPDNLCTVAPVAGPVRNPCIFAPETVGRPVGIMAFVPGVADQDQLAADVAGWKLGGATTAIVERLSGRAGEPATRVSEDGHDDFHRGLECVESQRPSVAAAVSKRPRGRIALLKGA
jgi:hypothetical protein